MNVGQLKELIEDLADDVEVRMAHQPHWPLQTTVSKGVAVGTNDCRIEELLEALDDDGALLPTDRAELLIDLANLRGEDVKVLYLAEGGHPHDESPYLPGSVSAELGWR